ncbi:MAG: ferrous iron transport protein B [Bernardetiaceae bacterium]
MKKIALIGNPNSGKSSVFNQLTGLNQHVGNYPGVTVDKKTGLTQLLDGSVASVLDLPGTYSIYPRSEDERVVAELFQNPVHPDYPDLVVVVADAANLQRNLLLFTQIYDLGLPTILILNMMDVAQRDGWTIHLPTLQAQFGGIPMVQMNARKGTGLNELKKHIAEYPDLPRQPFYDPAGNEALPPEEQQICETQARYQKLKHILDAAVRRADASPKKSLTQTIDRWVVHPVGGYVIFFGVLLLIFQSIYSLAELPMELIDGIFLHLSQWIKSSLPAGPFTDLIAEGILPGIGGVMIFIPQIALLFLFIAILEESGYMSRAVFIMDKLMRPFGLNGKSVVPLISGLACAIPAVMSTRTIGDRKDRLITILVTPLMSCSARLPVYTLLIALVIPDQRWGPFNFRGLTLFSLYLLGLVSALLVAAIAQRLIQARKKSFLVMELPRYKVPRWKNIALTILEKVRLFVWEAGRVILAIAVVLWVLASYGPDPSEDTLWSNTRTEQLNQSWIGRMGQQIEPVIAPLGYDWKIGIALLTSFAAREVFVGSMATIYSVGEDFEEDTASLMTRMRQETHPDGRPVYTLASGLSLMVFYVFAMQCMSTLAIVRRETKSWRWPLIQLLYMTGLAYGAAWLTFQLF